MRLEPFAMERWQSTWEHQVEINLSESGVEALTVEELLGMPGHDPAPEPGAYLRTPLGYAQGNGAVELRERIALLYGGAGPENILVTHGGSEANFLTTLALVEKGDRAVVMVPNYLQTLGLARGWGAGASTFPLREENGWDADIEALEKAVNKKTRLIVVTNPNNPTGKVFHERFIDRVVAAAWRVGAWILSDEIYRGAELHGSETPSFWGRYERLFVTSGLSKAYGLPGLRTGWVASPDREMIDTLWSYHDYTTICPSPLLETLALAALDPVRRATILDRTRRILRGNVSIVLRWASERGDRLAWHPPDAGAIFWVRYAANIGSSDLAERIRAEENVLIVPGDHFGMDRYIRIGFGMPAESLTEGLARIGRVLDRLG